MRVSQESKFKFNINDLPDAANFSEIALHLDNSQDDRQGLEADLQRVSFWADKWVMVVNVKVKVNANQDQCLTL